MISTIIVAIISFASTNIDDIVVLMLFFSQVNTVMKKKHIVIGQYLGIGVLTIISIIGALGISIIQKQYVGLLGLVPIYLGIKSYFDYKKQKTENVNNENINKKDIKKEKKLIKSIKNFINPNILKVFSITFANGGDNIGIYIPLFTSMNLVSILITVIIFIVLIAFWCFIALKLSERPFVRKSIEKCDHIFIPIIFIGLGIFILVKNGTVSLVR